jgi:hypothetical protein
VRLCREDRRAKGLYPVATVILGGLISSTLLDFFVRPDLFWTFGRRAALRAMKHHTREPDLTEPESRGHTRADSRDRVVA